MNIRIAVLLTGLACASSLIAQNGYSLESTIGLIGARTEAQMLDLLNEKGVNFEWSAEVEGRLVRAGATQKIIARIREIAPKPKPQTADLSVHCAPAECDIKINGESVGSTTGGNLEKSGIPAGEATVDFSKQGFAFLHQVATLAPGSKVAVSAMLEMTEEGRRAMGAEIFQGMLRATGFDKKEIPALAGDGSLTTFDGPKTAEWNFHFTASGDQMELVAESAANGGLALDCSSQTCQPAKKGGILFGRPKPVKGDLAGALENDLRIYAQYHFTRVMSMLKEPNVQFALTRSDSGSSDIRLVADARDTTYTLTLGSDKLPSLLNYKPKSGLGGMTITFSDYGQVEQIRYPKRTTINLGDPAHVSGIEVRLGTLGNPPSLRKK